MPTYHMRFIRATFQPYEVDVDAESIEEAEDKIERNPDYYAKIGEPEDVDLGAWGSEAHNIECLDDDDDLNDRPFREEQPIIDRMERHGDDDGDPTRYDDDDPMYRGSPNEDMSWMDDEED